MLENDCYSKALRKLHAKAGWLDLELASLVFRSDLDVHVGQGLLPLTNQFFFEDFILRDNPWIVVEASRIILTCRASILKPGAEEDHPGTPLLDRPD